jgi:hypothetical protein
LVGTTPNQLSIAAAFDALMHGLADLIRSERAWGAVHRALYFAVQVEITLKLIQTVSHSPRPTMTCWRTDLENYPRYVGLLAAFPILVVMYLLPAALEGPGLAAVLATLVLPGISVLWQAWRTASVKPPGERSVDMNFLPRAPTTFLLVTLAGMTGAITEGLLSIFFPGQHWFGLAVLVIWLAWSILLAAQWRRKMLKARRTLEQFLARDPERSMLFPTSKHDRERAEQAFLAHSLEPETLWPPR